MTKRKKRQPDQKKLLTPARQLIGLVMLFFLLGFLTLGLWLYTEGNNAWPRALVMAAAVPALIYVGVLGIPRLFPGDRLLLSLTNFLCAFGVLILFRLNPDRGISQAFNYLVGVIAMLLCAVAFRLIRQWKWPVLALMAASVALLTLPLIYGSEINGARNWVTLFGFGFQPSELVKISLLISVCWLLSKRRLIWAAGLTGISLLLLMLQKDMGTALLYYGTVLAALWAATGSGFILLFGAAGAAAGGYLGYRMFAHVKKRVAVWLNPWADRQGAGYQIVQGLIAIANGGLWGLGLGLGNPGVIPASYNDYIFTVICHEFGVLFGIVVLTIYLAIVLRGISIARRADNAFHALLALSCSVMLGLQTFVIVGGNIKLIPLTGVTLPFISYGGTSLVSSLCLVGVLQGISARTRADAAPADGASRKGRPAPRRKEGRR